MISPERRNLFGDLYRLAEYYENPPFKAGDIEGNAKWFDEATKQTLTPFLNKYKDGDLNQLSIALAIAVVDEASKKAAALNKMPF